MKNLSINAGLAIQESSTPNAYADDYQIAQEIAAGNRELFKDIYDRNASVLYNLARRLTKTTVEAEDIVQDTFIRAYQKINLFAGRSSLSSWLYRICVNVGLEYLRKQKGKFEDLNDSNCGNVEPDQKKLILRQKLNKAIKRLPNGCRMVFVLHDIEGFNHREIAERMNFAEGTSKSQLFKARAMLKKILVG
ncbi:MAG: RNA polymerase sigma factor [Candidatus Zixiibacteriota bacterium]